MTFEDVISTLIHLDFLIKTAKGYRLRINRNLISEYVEKAGSRGYPVAIDENLRWIPYSEKMTADIEMLPELPILV
jgi:hypothetical protein